MGTTGVVRAGGGHFIGFRIHDFIQGLRLGTIGFRGVEVGRLSRFRGLSSLN